MSGIVRFIYHGEAKVEEDKLAGFLQAAETLGIRGLTEDKRGIKKEKVTVQTKTETQFESKEDLGAVKVKQETKEYIEEDTKADLMEEEDEEVVDSPPSASQDYLMNDNIGINSMEEVVDSPAPADFSQDNFMNDDIVMNNMEEEDQEVVDSHSAAGQDDFMNDDIEMNNNTQNYDKVGVIGKDYSLADPSKNIGDIKKKIAKRMYLDEDDYWRCKKCEYKSPQKGSVYDHVDAMHMKHGGYKCNHCNKIVSSYNAFRLHLKRYHLVRNSSDDHEKFEWFYEMVDEDVDVKEAVNQKMIKDSGHDFWTCVDCSHRDAFKGNMFKHVEANHIKHGGYKCVLCEKILKTFNSLSNHLKRHLHSTSKS